MHLNALASEDDARVTGFDGEKKAAFYIENTLKEYGYVTGRQFFPVTAYSHQYTRLVLCGKEGRQEIECEPLMYSGGTMGETVRYRVAFAYTGEVSDFGEKYSEDTIVVLNNRTLSYRKKALNAMAAGAKAVLIYNDENEMFRGTVSSPIDIPVLAADFLAGTRIVNTVLNGPVYAELTCSTIIKPAITQNITAFRRHTGQERPYMIIGAHYDSVNTPGANDNASGVAMVLELGRLFSACDPGYDLRFVLFGSEELGLNGSEEYAKGLPEKYNCLGMINLDVIAEGDSIRLSTDDRQKSSLLYRIIEQVVSESGLPWEFEGYAQSDQRSFTVEGIAAILISAGPLTTLHTDRDTIENINMDIMMKTGEIVVRILQAVSDNLYRFK